MTLSKEELQEELTRRALSFVARSNKQQLLKQLLNHDDEMSLQPSPPPFHITSTFPVTKLAKRRYVSR